MGYLDNGSQVIVLPSQYLTSDEQRDMLVEILKESEGEWFFAFQLERLLVREAEIIQESTGRDIRYSHLLWCGNRIGQLLRYEPRIEREKVHYWDGFYSSKLYRYRYCDPNNIEWWLENK